MLSAKASLTCVGGVIARRRLLRWAALPGPCQSSRLLPSRSGCAQSLQSPVHCAPHDGKRQMLQTEGRKEGKSGDGSGWHADFAAETIHMGAGRGGG